MFKKKYIHFSSTYFGYYSIFIIFELMNSIDCLKKKLIDTLNLIFEFVYIILLYNYYLQIIGRF